MKHSYIAISKATGKAALEFFDERLKGHINTDNYEVVTAMTYLSALNDRITARGQRTKGPSQLTGGNT